MTLSMVTISWAGYNLFRLAAVGIMAWALVNQFIAMSECAVFDQIQRSSLELSRSDMTIYRDTLRGSGDVDLHPTAILTTQVDSYYGASAVPNQPGGPL
jgi:hypothetical protein